MLLLGPTRYHYPRSHVATSALRAMLVPGDLTADPPRAAGLCQRVPSHAWTGLHWRDYKSVWMEVHVRAQSVAADRRVHTAAIRCCGQPYSCPVCRGNIQLQALGGFVAALAALRFRWSMYS